MPPHKTESVKIRMTPLQKEMLKQLAEKMGLDMSSVVIHLITTARAKL
jgi:antitoxin component of RelBE/YafQ-DinJ toxin-antitoxin module